MSKTGAESPSEFWQSSLESLQVELHADGSGVDEAEVARRLTAYGPNALRPHRERALALQFLSRFANPLIILLLAAATISAFTGEVASFVIIAAVVVLSVTLDFVQEYRAGRAAERLKQSVALRATVVRNEQPTEVACDRIVPGDVVRLRPGALIPADGRVLEARDFFVNQALLTGETYPVEKHAGEIVDRASDMSTASNAVFMGTSVISGSGPEGKPMTKMFKVYKHPVKGFEAVKLGFSWPAFCFGGIWMLFKKLWGLALLWFGFYFVFSLIWSVTAETEYAGVQPHTAQGRRPCR